MSAIESAKFAGGDGRGARILGVKQRWLGFVDSGLPEGDPLPPLPEGCFALVPLEESTRALVKVIREFRPHVVTTYDENGGYPHPDHIRCHEVTMAAYEAAADPEYFPEDGQPWEIKKVYYSHGFIRKRLELFQEEYERRGEPFPMADWLKKWKTERGDMMVRVTTQSRAATTFPSVTMLCAHTRRRSIPTVRSSLCRSTFSRRSGPPRNSSSPRRGHHVHSGNRPVRRSRRGRSEVNALSAEVVLGTTQFLAQTPSNPSGPEFGKSSPVGLLVILALLIGVILLVRSMNRQLKKLPETFEPDHPELDQQADEGTDRGAITAPSPAEPNVSTEKKPKQES